MAGRKIGLKNTDAEKYSLVKMGVAERNILSDWNSVFARVRSGDTVCVVSVKSVAWSVNDFLAIMYRLSSNGIDFISCEEKRLSFSSAKPMQSSVHKLLQDLASIEADTNVFLSKCKIEVAHREQTIARLQHNSVSLLSRILNNETHYKLRT
jgi:DNA invertase Pin-like site-specific DNA recombinase